MGYEARATRAYGRPAAAVVDQATEAVARLGGKAGKGSRPADGHLEAAFNKAVAGKTFMNRCELVVQVTADGPERCAVAVEAYPVDPMGKKLLFGVMGEPAKLVATAFCQELDARLTGA